MTTVGFIGLGIMGRPMATNLIIAGYDVIGYDHSPERTEALTRVGGQPASGVVELVQKSDIVITMVRDSADVEAVALGEQGILASACPGQLYIDMTSILPQTARQVAEAGKTCGVRVLDAPVSGGEAGAVEGHLSIMVGGETADFEAARPVLDVLGETIVHVGPHGAGQTVKAANQLIVAGTIELVAEAIVFLEAHGVDTEAAVKVLAGGLAGNRILDRKAAGMLARQFQPGFRVDLHHKDMGIVTSAAREAGVVIPLGSAVAQLIAALKAQGDGGLDHSALLKLVEQLSGRSAA
ncbi:2-hydroxy-3-oxopropionate reductase [Micromonospora sp. CA-259024]|uniref:2-hydroxy-3-oxopropionate reductase n=1 Tax=Micromonospora sp. CA-259024 TaxID=3239965 RepID=UPI003D935EC7